MITSKKIGFLIESRLRASGVKVIFYHGDDSKREEDINQKTGDFEGYASHISVKQKHFKNVNQYWKHYDVVLHNSAITAGVSFDNPDHFDVQVNVYSDQTTTPLSFF